MSLTPGHPPRDGRADEAKRLLRDLREVTGPVSTGLLMLAAAALRLGDRPAR